MCALLAGTDCGELAAAVHIQEPAGIDPPTEGPLPPPAAGEAPAPVAGGLWYDTDCPLD